MRRLKIAEPAQARALRAGKNEMVEDRAIDCFGRGRQPARGAAIGIAWAGVATRMVVGEDDPRASELRRVGDNLGEREVGTGLRTDMAAEVQAAQLVVDMRDPKAFARRIGIGEATGKEFPRSGDAVEFKREFGTLIPHAT